LGDQPKGSRGCSRKQSRPAYSEIVRTGNIHLFFRFSLFGAAADCAKHDSTFAAHRPALTALQNPRGTVGAARGGSADLCAARRHHCEKDDE